MLRNQLPNSVSDLWVWVHSIGITPPVKKVTLITIGIFQRRRQFYWPVTWLTLVHWKTFLYHFEAIGQGFHLVPRFMGFYSILLKILAPKKRKKNARLFRRPCRFLFFDKRFQMK